MTFPLVRRPLVVVVIGLFSVLDGPGAGRAQIPVKTDQVGQLGGSYKDLDARRRQLIDNWVSRFNDATGLNVEPGPFYDDIVSLSGRTTFDAGTHALMRTPLTDASGKALGDGLDLLERVDAVQGELEGAAGDRQFRMYARLTANALDILERSREFARGADNTVYHKGYPVSYRQRGGTPSIQISVSVDGRRADIDVDYRSASFPTSMFNGHLTSSNSDVRAGNNYNKHENRWTGLENWWRSFFGIRLTAPAAPADKFRSLPRTPRAGKKDVHAMMQDFLQAWLVEGDVIAAMGYISERAHACLAKEGEDPSALDRGMAPYQLLTNLKAAHDAVGTRRSLEGLIAPVRLARPELKPVKHPHEPQFALYSVPDDIAARFDCESLLTPGDPKRMARNYGDYFGSTFRITMAESKGHTLALLWAKEAGYWKIVSWQSEPDGGVRLAAEPVPDVTIERIKADPAFAKASRTFLESWLVRKNYDAAFRYISPSSYTCYDLFRSPDQPASSSPEDAGRRIRSALERTGYQLGRVRGLDAVVSPADPSHPAVRVMEHPSARAFTLVGYPESIARAADCAARARGERFDTDAPLEYGHAFGINMRFLTRDGEGPVLRTLWRRENDLWQITAYDVEVP